MATKREIPEETPVERMKEMETKKELPEETPAGTGEKRVKIRLPIIPGRNNGPEFVAVNEKTYLIKRGIEVEVPESVYEVLRNAEEAQAEAMAYQESNELH